MKVYQFISTFLFLLIFSGCLSAQTITIGQFVVANTYLDNNNKIEVTDDADAPILIALSASRPSFFDKPVQLEAKLVFIGQNGEYDASSIVTFSTVDFVGSSAFSINKENISATILSTNNNGQLKVKYRYYAQDYSGEPDGWTEWFTKTDKHYTTVNLTPVPVTTFVGPDQICDEGTYTITNPDVITLENATNIATLTNLGNNQYKITRIGSGNGIINIKSTTDNISSFRKVNIGSPSPTISGQNIVWSGNEYYYVITKNDPNSTIDVLQAGGPGLPYQVEKYGDSGIKLTTSFIGNDVNDYIIRLRVTETNVCGTSGVTNLTVRFRGGVGPIQ